MDQDSAEYTAITYMFLSKGKWKTRTEVIESKNIKQYQKHRILNDMPMDEYYRSLERLP